MNKRVDVFFVPGTMCNEKLWNNTFDYFKNIDPFVINIFECNNFNEINSKLLKQLPENPSHLVGFSLGGYALVNFAKEYPERVKSLIIIAASCKGLNNKEIDLRNNYANVLKKSVYRGISESRIKQFINEEHPENKKLVDIIKEMDSDLGKEVLIRQLEATTQRKDLTNWLSEIKIPVLIIAAEKDKIVNNQELKQMKGKLNNSFFLNVKNSGHMIPLEKPEILSETIQRFVESIPS